MELTLTKHFIDRWMERVGNWPTVEAVSHFLAQSVKVQGCLDLMHPDGTPFRMLAIYWHPELDLLIKMDTTCNAAVTVLSRDNWGRKKKKAAAPAPQMPPANTIMGRRILRIREMFGLNRRYA